MLNLPEIIIVLVIIAIVFGFGKVGKIGANLGRSKKEFKRGLAGEAGPANHKGDREMIDITPTDDDDASWSPKPGARKQSVEDAELDTNETK